MVTDVTELAKSIVRQRPAEAALQARAEAAELALSQEQFMRQAAEAEAERLRAALADCQQSERYARGEMARLTRLVGPLSHGR